MMFLGALLVLFCKISAMEHRKPNICTNTTLIYSLHRGIGGQTTGECKKNEEIGQKTGMEIEKWESGCIPLPTRGPQSGEG